MIGLNPQSYKMRKIADEYDLIERNITTFSVVQMEKHMRNIHILSAKYKSLCTE